MQDLARLLRFVWPYIRGHMPRFSTGIVLAILFGITNGLLLWAINSLLNRMSPGVPPDAATTATALAQGTLAEWKSTLHAASERYLDPWLPRAGRPLDTRQMAGGILLFPLLAALRGFLGYASSYCLAWVSERVINDLRVNVLRKLTSLSLDYFNNATIGDLITRVNGDTAMLQRCLNVGLSDAFKEPVTILGILLGLFLIDWQLTLLTMVFFPLVILPVIVLGKKVRRSARAGVKTSVVQASLIVETLSGIRAVKAFNLENRMVERFRKLSLQLFGSSMRITRAKEIANPIVETVGSLGFGVLVVIVAIRGARLEDMISLLAGVAFIYTPIRKLTGIHNLLEQTHAGVERLMQVLAEQPSVREPSLPTPIPRFEHELHIDNLSFSYGHRDVLHNVSLRIPRGSKLGIAGESGSGKSTLVNLLFRFYDPTQGAIHIDHLDLRNASLSDLRNLMALVSQEIVLFDMTVAENIACGRLDASQADIEAAARAAFADDFIRRMPEGYQTRVTERGANLSGGQRQRLAIARAFVRNAPILVLDEATAALDAKSQAEVQAAIERLTENRTVICVAHQLATLRSMDQIVVLDSGRIAEQGSFDELLLKGGLFTDMARRQGLVPPHPRPTPAG
jgi:subfamily B ATP-binding cassette protein MsbA